MSTIKESIKVLHRLVENWTSYQRWASSKQKEEIVYLCMDILIKEGYSVDYKDSNKEYK